MRRYLSFLACWLCVASLVFGQQKQKRIAVLSFDYATVTSYVAEIFGSNQDVGKGIADLLIARLFSDHAYRVIEREKLDKILGEQNFSNSDRADATTAAKIGRILGVDAIVVGSVTQFGRDDKSVGVNAGAFGLGRFGVGNVGKKKSKAVVGISARMVDVNTGEILAVATGRGESERSGTLLGGGGGGGWNGGGGGLDMSSSNFGETILGEAVHQAVNDVATKLNQSAGGLPTTVAHFSGEVADVSGNTLIVNIGSKAGLQVGDKLEIKHFVRSVKDPATGKVLKKIENAIGTLTITEVDADSATGTFSGAAVPKVGDGAEGGGN